MTWRSTDNWPILTQAAGGRGRLRRTGQGLRSETAVSGTGLGDKFRSAGGRSGRLSRMGRTHEPTARLAADDAAPAQEHVDDPST